MSETLDDIRARATAYREHGTPGLAAPRDRAELLAIIERVEEVLDNWTAEVPFQDADESQRWYSLGKRHAGERIRAEIRGGL